MRGPRWTPCPSSLWAQQAAADDLKNARHYLQEGDSALQQRLPPAVVDHDAYLASRSAQAGEARVQEAQGQSADCGGTD